MSASTTSPSLPSFRRSPTNPMVLTNIGMQYADQCAENETVLLYDHSSTVTTTYAILQKQNGVMNYYTHTCPVHDFSPQHFTFNITTSA